MNAIVQCHRIVRRKTWITAFNFSSMIAKFDRVWKMSYDLLTRYLQVDRVISLDTHKTVAVTIRRRASPTLFISDFAPSDEVPMWRKAKRNRTRTTGMEALDPNGRQQWIGTLKFIAVGSWICEPRHDCLNVGVIEQAQAALRCACPARRQHQFIQGMDEMNSYGQGAGWDQYRYVESIHNVHCCVWIGNRFLNAARSRSRDLSKNDALWKFLSDAPQLIKRLPHPLLHKKCEIGFGTSVISFP
jgi:hypothetical protein